jgi:glutamine synthetase
MCSAFLDLYLTDYNGRMRGKRLHGDSLEDLRKKDMMLSSSVYSADIWGEIVEATGFGIAQGDPDYHCQLIEHSLRPQPFRDNAWQAMVELVDHRGQPMDISPRQVLRRQIDHLGALGYTPVVAVELEFYLLEPVGTLDGCPRPARPLSPRRSGAHNDLYSMRSLDEYAPFLEDLQQACGQMQLPVLSVISEDAPGQFEVNLAHGPDVLKICDQALMLKRTIWQTARRHGLDVTFMAKPWGDQCGNGQHVHVSLLDPEGNNAFAVSKDILEQALGGMLERMAESFLLLAPGSNSYRRFVPGHFAPLKACWGYNNRTTALRIPASDAANTRIEYRVAGADASPCLVVAAVLGGILSGLMQHTHAPAPVSGDACDGLHDLPISWQSALQAFSQSDWAAETFGAAFHRAYGLIKQHEMRIFQSRVTPFEWDAYLLAL